MALLVTCTGKDLSREVPERIRSIGGRTVRSGTGSIAWSTTQASAIAEIESGEETYYVNIGGHTPNLVVASYKDAKYLKATIDRESPDSLLNLPDCKT